MSMFFARVFGGRKREIVLARSWQARSEAEAACAANAEAVAFGKALRCEPGSGRVVLGRVNGIDGDPFWVGLKVKDLLGQHWLASGATGAGKTMTCLIWLMQVLQKGNVPVVVLDLKGELTALLLDVVLPVLAHASKNPTYVKQIRVVRPFDREYVPLLRLTEPEPNVERAVQAHLIAEALEEALGADVGIRMTRILVKLATVAIEFNLPLMVLVTWLSDPKRFIEIAQRSSDPSIRQYARGPFLREEKSSLAALLARLDLFFEFEAVRTALSAPGCFSIPEALEGGVTVIGLGDPPAGAERVNRFVGGVLVGRLSRAILSRPASEKTRQTVVLFEEWPEVIRSRQAEQFNRLVALSRYKKVSCWLTVQQSSQIGSIDPGLLKSVQTNCAIQAQFRSNLDDARAFAHAMPVPKDGTATTREDLVGELTRLPDREFLLWLRRFPFRAQRVRSPRIDLEKLRALAAAVPEETRKRIRQGAVAIPRTELPKESPSCDVGTNDDERPDFLAPRHHTGPGDPGIG